MVKSGIDPTLRLSIMESAWTSVIAKFYDHDTELLFKNYPYLQGHKQAQQFITNNRNTVSFNEYEKLLSREKNINEFVALFNQQL